MTTFLGVLWNLAYIKVYKYLTKWMRVRRPPSPTHFFMRILTHLYSAIVVPRPQNTLIIMRMHETVMCVGVALWSTPQREFYALAQWEYECSPCECEGSSDLAAACSPTYTNAWYRTVFVGLGYNSDHWSSHLFFCISCSENFLQPYLSLRYWAIFSSLVLSSTSFWSKLQSYSFAALSPPNKLKVWRVH